MFRTFKNKGHGFDVLMAQIWKKGDCCALGARHVLRRCRLDCQSGHSGWYPASKQFFTHKVKYVICFSFKNRLGQLE